MIFISGNIFLIYIRKRIGETSEPCEIPILKLVFSYLFPSNASYKYLLFIKHSIQLHNDLGRPKFWHIFSNWFAETWSKAPFTSINKTDVSFFSCFTNWMSSWFTLNYNNININMNILFNYLKIILIFIVY